MNITRRDMLKLGAGATALWAAGDALGGAPQERAKAQAASAPAGQAEPRAPKEIPIGLQLYSVREDCARDLPGVLKAVAAMGYAGVEFAGYYGRPAAELHRMLSDLGLKCCGTHTGLETLLGDALPATAEFNRALGNRYLIVPSLPAERTRSVAALEETARLLTELAERARPLGLRVGYHAHAGDFRPVAGQAPWDVIFGRAGPDVVMQLDTGNCLAGGGDPVAVLRRYPGRSATIHLKEHGGKPGAVIGEGAVPWPEVLGLCAASGGTEWFIVEQETYAAEPLESVRACLRNLRKLLA